MHKHMRCSPEVWKRAVRLAYENQGDYGSQWAPMVSIAPKIGCTPVTLRTWVR